MKDQQLQKAVIDELAYEPSVDEANIGVAAENGVVTLTGHVSSYREKLAVEKSVKRIKGVKGVKGIAAEIEVRYPTDKKVHDDQIAQRALSILAWTTSLPPSAIKVTVQQRIVELSGRVDWQFQRTAAEASVRQISGVTGIINHITLADSTQPADVKERIASALKRRAQVEADRIEVSVDRTGQVALKGDVDNWDVCRAVEQAAWSVPGVRAVNDRLMIA